MKITRYVAFEPLLLFSRKGLAIWKTSFWWSGMSACYCWFCQSPIFTREAIDGSLRVAGICFCVVTLINCFTVDDEKERIGAKAGSGTKIQRPNGPKVLYEEILTEG